MFSKLVVTTTALATLMHSASALAGTLEGYINGIDQSRWYNDGEHIACSHEPGSYGTGVAICAFLQSTNGASGASLIPLAKDIVNHGCPICGSVPTDYAQGDNNVNDGELTFNFVSSPNCGEGLC